MIWYVKILRQDRFKLYKSRHQPKIYIFVIINQVFCVTQKNHILNSFKTRHIKFSCCFAHILDQNKVFLFTLFYRQFCNVYFPVARLGTETQERSELLLPLPFLEFFSLTPYNSLTHCLILIKNRLYVHICLPSFQTNIKIIISKTGIRFSLQMQF